MFAAYDETVSTSSPGGEGTIFVAFTSESTPVTFSTGGRQDVAQTQELVGQAREAEWARINAYGELATVRVFGARGALQHLKLSFASQGENADANRHDVESAVRSRPAGAVQRRVTHLLWSLADFRLG